MSETDRQRVVKILRTEPAIQKINFEFNGCRIWPGAYEKVADAIDRGEIRIDAVPYNSSDLGGASAKYNAEVDVMTVASGLPAGSIGLVADVIHEATHAYLDLLNDTKHPIKRKTGEGCAYTADATYHVVTGGSIDRVSPTAGIYAVAMPIAKDIVVGGKYNVPAVDVSALEAAVKANPLYTDTAEQIYESNGFTRGVMSKIKRGLY